MPTHCIVDAEKDADMKSLSPKEAIAILSDMKIDIPVPKAAVTQRKRNVALDMAISALNCSEIPNSSDSISKQAAIEAIANEVEPFVIVEPGTTCVIGAGVKEADVFSKLESLPSADVMQVVHGKWIDTDNYYRRWKCSECGSHTKEAQPPFCPYCGADMRGEQE